MELLTTLSSHSDALISSAYFQPSSSGTSMQPSASDVISKSSMQPSASGTVSTSYFQPSSSGTVNTPSIQLIASGSVTTSSLQPISSDTISTSSSLKPSASDMISTSSSYLQPSASIITISNSKSKPYSRPTSKSKVKSTSVPDARIRISGFNRQMKQNVDDSEHRVTIASTGSSLYTTVCTSNSLRDPMIDVYYDKDIYGSYHSTVVRCDQLTGAFACIEIAKQLHILNIGPKINTWCIQKVEHTVPGSSNVEVKYQISMTYANCVSMKRKPVDWPLSRDQVSQQIYNIRRVICNRVNVINFDDLQYAFCIGSQSIMLVGASLNSANSNSLYEAVDLTACIPWMEPAELNDLWHAVAYGVKKLVERCVRDVEVMAPV